MRVLALLSAFSLCGLAKDYSSVYSVYMKSSHGGPRSYRAPQRQVGSRRMEDIQDDPSEVLNTAKQWGFTLSASGGVGEGKSSTGSQDSHFAGFFGLGMSSKISPTVGILAVADGHGEYGHLISNKVIEVLFARSEIQLSNYTQRIYFAAQEDKARQAYFNGPSIKKTPKDYSIDILKSVAYDIPTVAQKMCSGPQHSGSTLSTLYWDFQRNVAVVANVGDSPIWKIDRANKRFVPLTDGHGMDTRKHFEDVADRIKSWFTNNTASFTFDKDKGSLTISWNNYDQYNETASKFDFSQLLKMLPRSDKIVNEAADGETTDVADKPSANQPSAGADQPSADANQPSAGQADKVEPSASFLAMREDATGPSPGSSDSPTTDEADGPPTGSGSETSNIDWADFFANADPVKLPHISGEPVQRNSRRASANLSITLKTNLDKNDKVVSVLTSLRLGFINMARGIADSQTAEPNPFAMLMGGQSQDELTSSAFVRSDPYVAAFDLEKPDEAFDEVMLASDGVEDAIIYSIMPEVYRERISECRPDGPVECLPDLVELLQQYSEQTEVVYKPFWDAFEKFQSIIDDLVQKRLYEVFASVNIKSEDTIAEEFRRKIEDIDDSSKLPSLDDITVVYFKRSSSPTLVTIKRHIVD